MPFTPHTEADIAAMLQAIGVDSIEDLFDEIPAELRTGKLTVVPPQRGEMDVSRFIRQKAAQDGTPLCFAGAGAYEHHIPAAIWQIVTRGEYYTAYTPYQAEVSQGTLQMIYEFQTMMAKLTGMEVSNASLYDGASALAEAALMAVRSNRKSKSRVILVPRTLNPVYRDVLHNIVHNQDIKVVDLDYDTASGTVTAEQLKALEGQDITAVVIPQPNFFGRFEDVHTLTDWAHANGALAIAVVNPTALTLLEAPGQWGETGADICVGEGQPLGVPLSSGGPYFGFMTTRQKFIRQMPGRIVGQTTDTEGNIGYTLTFQAREQHIRRAKATSNICTNQGLMVSAATVYMALMGPQGLKNVALASMQKARQLEEKLQSVAGVNSVFASPGFHEFVVQLDQPVTPVLKRLAADKIVGGVDISQSHPELGNALLLCATETKTDEELDTFVAALQKALQENKAA
jgi:glycine dehydrogenase subunit 1